MYYLYPYFDFLSHNLDFLFLFLLVLMGFHTLIIMHKYVNVYIQIETINVLS